MIELKETHKTHNIQPQHGHDGTRDSRSFSKLSDSGGRTAARLGLRRRSTVAVGRNDHVSVPRSTAKHGRRRHFGRYGRVVELDVALTSFARDVVELQLFGSLATSCRVTSRRPPNNVTQHTARGFHGRPSRAQIVSTPSSQ